MVKSSTFQAKTIFLCESCGFGYADEKLAKKCEDFCNANKSCNLQITKYAIKR